jgi:hypothetical protein
MVPHPGTITAMSTAEAYEARYGFPPSYARLLFVCAAFAVGSLFVALPPTLRVVELAVFGGGGLVLIALGLRATRLVALRVDESGLTLGGSPTSYRSTTRVVPWPELRAVRLTRETGGARLPVLTAVRRGNREDFSKRVQGWRLDPDKLAEALKATKVSFLDNR